MDDNTKETPNKIKFIHKLAQKNKSMIPNTHIDENKSQFIESPEKWKQAKKTYEDIARINNQHIKEMKYAQEWIEQTITNLDKFMGELARLIVQSQGKVDKYGMPTAMGIDEIPDILFEEKFQKKLQSEVVRYLSIDKDYSEDANKKLAIAFVNNTPRIIEKIKHKIGEIIQKYIRDLEQMSNSSIKRKTTKPKGISKETEKKYAKIIAEYGELESEGYEPKDIHKMLGHKFSLSPKTIKKIYH